MQTVLTPVLISLALAAGLAACSRQEGAGTSPATPATTAPAATPAPAPAVATAENPVGKSTYNKVCALCHSAGVGGAPKPGDKADWGPRIAQGDELLFKHALEGFTGAKGAMPPRGGSTTLTDEEVKAAVTHMTGLSR